MYMAAKFILVKPFKNNFRLNLTVSEKFRQVLTSLNQFVQVLSSGKDANKYFFYKILNNISNLTLKIKFNL